MCGRSGRILRALAVGRGWAVDCSNEGVVVWRTRGNRAGRLSRMAKSSAASRCGTSLTDASTAAGWVLTRADCSWWAGIAGQATTFLLLDRAKRRSSAVWATLACIGHFERHIGLQCNEHASFAELPPEPVSISFRRLLVGGGQIRVSIAAATTPHTLA